MFLRSAFFPILLALPMLSGCSTVSRSDGLRLPIEYHHQEHGLSCEVAALKMVLDHFGVVLSEAEILKKMPFDLTPHANGIWGDPDLAFVGDIDGKMGINGYGIHWNGLKRVSENWKKTVAIKDGRLEDLISHLAERRPVIVWGFDDSREILKWKTRGGREIVGLKGEHTRVVYGYSGKAGSPTGFFLMDPMTGPLFWSTREFLDNWDSFGRAGIVLYDEPPGNS